MFDQLKHLACVFAVSLSLFSWVSPVQADIDLEFRPATQIACPGDIVDIGLYAVTSDVPPLGSISTLVVILSWEPELLELVGRVDNGPYEWVYSRFPDDSGIDGLNDGCFGPEHDQPEGRECVPFNDGDAWYHAWSQLAPNPPAWATPEGLLVTTFRFRLLDEAPGQLEMISEYMNSHTRVLDAFEPGLDATGTLGPPATVLPCGIVIPTVSEWGLVVTVALLLAAGLTLKPWGRRLMRG